MSEPSVQIGEPSFQIGETVQMRIGGPIMIVVEDLGGTFACSWYDERKGVLTADFTAAQLQPASFPDR